MYAEIAASGTPAINEVLARLRPDGANRQAAALFSVPDPGRMFFARLRFFWYNQTAPMSSASRLQLQRQLRPHRSGDSSIIAGVRKNAIESLEKALHKVVKSFSAAVPQLVYDLQREVNWFSQDQPTALPNTPRCAKRTRSSSGCSKSWKLVHSLKLLYKLFAAFM